MSSSLVGKTCFAKIIAAYILPVLFTIICFQAFLQILIILHPFDDLWFEKHTGPKNLMLPSEIAGTFVGYLRIRW